MKPDSGRVLLNGRDITSLSIPGRVRWHWPVISDQQCANGFYCFGKCHRCRASPLKAELSVLKPAFDDKDLQAGAYDILRRVGLEDRASYPASDLAHGERRMLELALALATAPQLLLLDEPMAGAGTEESQRMSEIIESLRGDVAILLIEHDMDAVFRLADRITVLVEGAVITAVQLMRSAIVRLYRRPIWEVHNHARSSQH